jgi:4-carboxymuconolactone decarboxylase
MMNDDEREKAAALLKKFSSKAMDRVAAQAAKAPFAKETGLLALENVFARLWGRPGLDHRSRSLVTMGILIALRAHEELRVHTAIALANGLTVAELEEVVYHASGYAGFPAANAARAAMLEALLLEGVLTEDGTGPTPL